MPQMKDITPLGVFRHYMYHGAKQYQDTLLAIVELINSGTLHPASADLLGDSLLYGLEKPDGSTRPIGVGASLRRVAGRVLMADRSADIGRVFTTTPVSPEMLTEAGFARDRRCNIPLQLGCGTKGGAEICFALLSLGLEKHPAWALFSEDKVNGFNAISRKSIFAGLRRWFPELIPAARLWYSRLGRLFIRGEKGFTLAVGPDGAPYFSSEGCTQGDPLGPFLFAVGYHLDLLRTQARQACLSCA